MKNNTWQKMNFIEYFVGLCDKHQIDTIEEKNEALKAYIESCPSKTNREYVHQRTMMKYYVDDPTWKSYIKWYQNRTGKRFPQKPRNKGNKGDKNE